MARKTDAETYLPINGIGPAYNTRKTVTSFSISHGYMDYLKRASRALGYGSLSEMLTIALSNVFPTPENAKDENRQFEQIDRFLNDPELFQRIPQVKEKSSPEKARGVGSIKVPKPGSKRPNFIPNSTKRTEAVNNPAPASNEDKFIASPKTRIRHEGPVIRTSDNEIDDETDYEEETEKTEWEENQEIYLENYPNGESRVIKETNDFGHRLDDDYLWTHTWNEGRTVKLSISADEWNESKLLVHEWDFAVLEGHTSDEMIKSFASGFPLLSADHQAVFEQYDIEMEQWEFNVLVLVGRYTGGHVEMPKSAKKFTVKK